MNFLLHRWDSYPAGMHMANICLKRIHGGISRVGCRVFRGQITHLLEADQEMHSICAFSDFLVREFKD